MKTLEQLPTTRDTQTKSKEEVMSHTAISSELTEATENGLTDQSIVSAEKIMSVESRKDKAYSLAFELISSILVVFIGLVVYKVSGLYDGMDSMIGKIVLGTGISYSYVAVFRHAIYRSR